MKTVLEQRFVFKKYLVVRCYLIRKVNSLENFVQSTNLQVLEVSGSSSLYQWCWAFLQISGPQEFDHNITCLHSLLFSFSLYCSSPGYSHKKLLCFIFQSLRWWRAISELEQTQGPGRAGKGSCWPCPLVEHRLRDSTRETTYTVAGVRWKLISPSLNDLG